MAPSHRIYVYWKGNYTSYVIKKIRNFVFTVIRTKRKRRRNKKWAVKLKTKGEAF